MNIITIALACLLTAQLAHSQERSTHAAPAKQKHAQLISQIRSAYAAFNRGDFDAAVAVLAPDVEWTEPAEFPGGGTYDGREAVKQYLMQSRAGWVEGSSEPERFIESGDRIVVFVRARFRDKQNPEWHEVQLADVYSIRKGQIVQMRAFADRHQALTWASATQQ